MSHRLLPKSTKGHPLAVDLPPNTIAFLVEGYPEPNLIRNVEKILLGRVESIGEMYLLDFTMYGGQFQGVSRRHAVITRENNTYIIEDENSTNGTWLNQTRLQPHQAYPLKNGDTLRLGKLLLHVYFNTPRKSSTNISISKNFLSTTC